MKINEFIKKAIDENIADKEDILNNTLSSPYQKQAYSKDRLTSRKMAFRAALSLAVISIIVGLNLFGGFPIRDHSEISQGKKSVKQGDTKKQPQKNIFTLVAYAAEKTNGNDTAKQETKMILKPNVKFQLPFGKITRTKKAYLIGEIKGKYPVEFAGGGFVGTGDNIDSVTITSEAGELDYFDSDRLKEMERRGQLYICRIPFSKEKMNPKWSIEKVVEVFYQMWSSGELDEYKNKYFAGKNINLDDYSIGLKYQGTPNIETVYLEIANKNNERPQYSQRGSTLVVKSDKNVGWCPIRTMEALENSETLKYEDAPGDILTITVKFVGGEIVKQTINLSLDKEGNVIGEIRQVPAS